jgi:hypothetical protein
MVGQGRHAVLGVRSVDPILSLVAPIGLAASVGTALVIDMVAPRGGEARRTLRDLAEDGPTLSELSPGRRGVAFLAGGGLEMARAIEVIERLSGRWPAITVRVAHHELGYPTIPVVPLYPGRLLIPAEPHGVWQPVGSGATPPGPGPVLPRLRPSVLRRILAGQLPRWSRWVAAWRPVWDMPWA